MYNLLSHNQDYFPIINRQWNFTLTKIFLIVNYYFHPRFSISHSIG